MASRCACAKAALDLTAWQLALRVDCISALDGVLSSASEGDDVVWALGRALADAESERRAREHAAREEAKAAAKAEAEAASAVDEAAKAVAKAKAKEEAARRRASKEEADAMARAEAEARSAAREEARQAERQAKAEAAAEKHVAKVAAEAEKKAEEAAAKQAAAVSKSEKEASAKAAKEAAAKEAAEKKEAEAAAKAEAAAAKEAAKAAAAASAAERKAAAERAKAEAQQIKAEAAAIVQRQREEAAAAAQQQAAQQAAADDAEAASSETAHEQAHEAPAAAPPVNAPTSCAGAISQTRLERAQGRLAASLSGVKAAPANLISRRNSALTVISSGSGTAGADAEQRSGGDVGAAARIGALGSGSKDALAGFKPWAVGSRKAAASALADDARRSSTSGAGGADTAADGPAEALSSSSVLARALGLDDGEERARWTQACERWKRQWASGAERQAEWEVATDCIGAHGDELLCSGADGCKTSLCVYSLAEGRTTLSLGGQGVGGGHDDRVLSVATHAVGGGDDAYDEGDEGEYLIVSGSRDKTIRVWSRASGACLAVLEGATESVFSVAISDRWIVGGEGSSRAGGLARARLWSYTASAGARHAGGAASSTPRAATSFKSGHGKSFAEHAGPVWSVALTHELAVSGSDDGTARVWPLRGAAARSVGVLRHPAWVCSVSVSRGDVCATACGDSKVRLWTLRAGAADAYTCVGTIEHCTGSSSTVPMRVRWAHGGGALVSCGMDCNVKVWTLRADGEATCEATLVHGESVRGLAVTDGGVVAGAGGSKHKSVIVWQPRA
jgi:hypothetical protein